MYKGPKYKNTTSPNPLTEQPTVWQSLVTRCKEDQCPILGLWNKSIQVGKIRVKLLLGLIS
jgi:hypothetical protein